MDRTLRAALVAALIGLVAVGGIAFFLGIAAAPSLISGVVAAVLFGGLILAAARRAEGFDDTPRTPPTPPTPRHPGPPDPAGDDPEQD